MDFLRLRLSGFKSFVDPTEFLIEPGLTGVVGPNGCGKSNVLEGLRWVMGANSAKALRGQGMDDVIFAGASQRPARSHAEVILTIDNARHRAPQPFTDAPVLEVSRRIDRGQGSTYRVNGKEVRLRDVQLLFADASTGANSPALVRQGQISELIAAKPQNRRRILEEAGGVSGLHTRRHEAELRLRAAETNLSRLDDIAGELESQLSRLKREGRHAERYRRISAEIRGLQSALVYARWADAAQALETARAELDQATREVEQTAAASAKAAAAAITASEALKPAREEDAVATALLNRAIIERDRLAMDEAQAQAELDRLAADKARIASDLERETAADEDASSQVERLARLIDQLEQEIAAAPDNAPRLQTAAEDAARASTEADRALEAATVALAEARATRQAALAQAEQIRRRAEQARAAADRAAAERRNLGEADAEALTPHQQRAEAADQALAAARAAAEAAEQALISARQHEAEARQAARSAEDQLNGLQAEARGLAQLLSRPAGEAAPVLDQLKPGKGYEAALAAALGDDVDAGLDSAAPLHWAGAQVQPCPFPAGVEPLSAHVQAPTQLAARLAWVGVADAAQAPSLARSLPVGARLVTMQGDLFRWDGFVARAEAPRPAAVRLAQRTRLEELETRIDALKPALDDARRTQAEAAQALQIAEAAVRDARRALPDAERSAAQARRDLDAAAVAQDRLLARIQAADDLLARLAAEAEEAGAAADALGDIDAGDEALEPLIRAQDEARAAAAEARQAAQTARNQLEDERREAAARERRLTSLKHDHADWTRRRQTARARIEGLERDLEKAAAAHLEAASRPDAFEARRQALLDGLSQAEARKQAAADAVSVAETAAGDADRSARAAEAAASAARESRAGIAARAEAEEQRLEQVERALRDTVQMSPDALRQKLDAEAIAAPPDADAAETLLRSLERDREALGPVNLRAEEESAEYQTRLQAMREERSDLTGAIAKLRDAIDELNAEGRQRLVAAFDVINANFQSLFGALFGGGQAELKLVESDDPLEAGLEIYACPPGKRLAVMSLMSGGEQALTATALIFAVFLANPAPVCVLDEVDAPLDDANVDRFCRMLEEMRERTDTRFIVITHNPVTMSRMDRLYGVTMPERGVSQLVSVDLRQAEALAAE
ncbi:chromosome segregation protein SMC [Brevundimonas sp. 2R-24]|uniref:Chromosome partition protein Smc n=1 Tax=Peiella sedimenti TaxID=3061083 RepID=A0ABT8SN62_9CAUL|nr:chromosome segregation protein SMC [Caulobacteraceae bacterium XZ-24]